MKRSKGFTLIELLAVIVILAIIALIATPMVLKYIENAKEGSNDISAESILRAADNYYAASLLDKNMTYPKEFDLANKDDMAILGLKGDAPDEGILEIYSDGTTFIEAMYDDVIYVKLPNETRVSKNPKVIASIKEWETNGEGTITKHKKMENYGEQYELFVTYIGACGMYANRDNSEFPFDFTKSLEENAKMYEEAYNVSRSILPLELNKEIDSMLTIFNTEEKVEGQALMDLYTNNKDKIPNAADYIEKIAANNNNILEHKVLQTIMDAGNKSNTVVVPNYVKHEDGTLEKITAIGEEAVGGLACTIAPLTVEESEKDLIISYGIKSIGKEAFYACFVNSVVLPSTIETIEESAFRGNRLTTIKLPHKLGTLERFVFASNALSGEIVIPKNVEIIYYRAFVGDKMFEGIDCDEMAKYSVQAGVACKKHPNDKNTITKVTFEEGSKIKEIRNEAFEDNNIDNLVIPGSIKFIDHNAFKCPTLTNVTIKRAQGSDLKVDSNAFPSTAVVKYEP